MPARRRSSARRATSIWTISPGCSPACRRRRQHVSSKLFRWFVGDDPADADLAPMLDAWNTTGGEIRSVLRALFLSDAFTPERAATRAHQEPRRLDDRRGARPRIGRDERSDRHDAGRSRGCASSTRRMSAAGRTARRGSARPIRCSASTSPGGVVDEERRASPARRTTPGSANWRTDSAVSR